MHHADSLITLLAGRRRSTSCTWETPSTKAARTTLPPAHQPAAARTSPCAWRQSASMLRQVRSAQVCWRCARTVFRRDRLELEGSSRRLRAERRPAANGRGPSARDVDGGDATVGGTGELVPGRPRKDRRPGGRPAPPCQSDEMMQAFAYKHLVPATDLKLTIPNRLGRSSIGSVLSAVAQFASAMNPARGSRPPLSSVPASSR